MTSYLVSVAMFALSLIVCELLAKQEKYHNFDLENEGQSQE